MEYFLDVTSEVCPLTFVKARLLIERMPVGAQAEIRLNAGEPLSNVPRALGELGHRILSIDAVTGDPAGVHRLVVEKAA